MQLALLHVNFNEKFISALVMSIQRCIRMSVFAQHSTVYNSCVWL